MIQNSISNSVGQSGKPAPRGPIASPVARRARGQSGSLSYAGQSLTPPAAVKYNAPNVNGTIQSAVQAAQAGQNAANQANNQRYGQGLGVLTGSANQANNFQQQGYNSLQQGQGAAQGYIQQAIQNSNGFGQSALTQVDRSLQQARGNTQQSAISRGLNNTTVMDSLQQGNEQTANLARQGIQEQQANRLSALNLNQANTAASFASQLAGQRNAQASGSRAGGTDIAGFIAARNDQAPSLGEYAGLVSAAAQGGPGKMTGTTVNTPANYTGGLGASVGAGQQQSYSPRSSVSINGSASGYTGGMGSGGGGGSSPQQGGYQGGSGGPISSAIQPQGSSSPQGGSSSGMPQQIGNMTMGANGLYSGMNNAGNTSIRELPEEGSSGSPSSSQSAAMGPGSMSMTKPGAAPKDIYKFFGVPPGSPLSDENYRTYNKAMGL